MLQAGNLKKGQVDTKRGTRAMWSESKALDLFFFFFRWWEGLDGSFSVPLPKCYPLMLQRWISGYHQIPPISPHIMHPCVQTSGTYDFTWIFFKNIYSNPIIVFPDGNDSNNVLLSLYIFIRISVLIAFLFYALHLWCILGVHPDWGRLLIEIRELSLIEIRKWGLLARLRLWI